VHNQLLQISLVGGAVPDVVYTLAAVAFVILVWRRPMRRWALVNALAVIAGLAIGFVVAWLIGDVANAFDVTLTFVTRLWFALGVAGILVAIASLWRTRWWRAIVAVASLLVFALMAGLGINADLGEFPTVATAIGSDRIEPLALTNHDHGEAQGTGSTWRHWDAPAFMPRKGRVGTVEIPATLSHFPARHAIVYLPPAELVRNPPPLPVLIMLSGQPGSPSDLVGSAELPRILNSYARAHRGLAPIVVMPDQLGSRGANPMCLDSPLGNSATYLTRDVPRWITAHLSVLAGPRYWGIGGFSEGGTCAIQLGAAHPGLFGSILDISGQVVPANGTVAQTIARAFHGSAAAYRAATPEALLAAGAPFGATLGIFGAGADDAKYAPQVATIFAAARAAGMDARHISSPGTAHDWRTVQYVFTSALPYLGARWGLSR
jgi:S-formylglutathione hydrolase FrmB